MRNLYIGFRFAYIRTMTRRPPARLSAKQLRTLHALSRHRTLRDAARELNTSQSALSRALSGAEDRLGASLFQRGWSGTEPTGAGEIVLDQCRRIIDDLDGFAQATEGVDPVRFRAFARWRHLETVAAVLQAGSASGAAATLGVRQPAVSQALRDLAAYVGSPLFRRHSAGLAPTDTARALAALWNRVSAALDRLPERIDSASRGLAGRVAVGMLPFSGQDLVMETFGALSRQHPNLRLVAVPGSYASLCDALKRREIDLIVGTLRDPPTLPGLCETFLYHETYTLIARRGHPCHSQPVTMESLAALNWMVAPHGTPVRRYFEGLYAGAAALPAVQSCEILSFANAEQVVVNNDAVSLLCYSDAGLAALRPDLRRVEIDLPDARVPIGITTVADAPLPPAVDAFVRFLTARSAARNGG